MSDSVAPSDGTFVPRPAILTFADLTELINQQCRAKFEFDGGTFICAKHCNCRSEGHSNNRNADPSSHPGLRASPGFYATAIVNQESGRVQAVHDGILPDGEVARLRTAHETLTASARRAAAAIHTPQTAGDNISTITGGSGAGSTAYHTAVSTPHNLGGDLGAESAGLREREARMEARLREGLEATVNSQFEALADRLLAVMSPRAPQDETIGAAAAQAAAVGRNPVRANEGTGGAGGSAPVQAHIGANGAGVSVAAGGGAGDEPRQYWAIRGSGRIFLTVEAALEHLRRNSLRLTGDDLQSFDNVEDALRFANEPNTSSGGTGGGGLGGGGDGAGDDGGGDGGGGSNSSGGGGNNGDDPESGYDPTLLNPINDESAGKEHTLFGFDVGLPDDQIAKRLFPRIDFPTSDISSQLLNCLVDFAYLPSVRNHNTSEAANLEKAMARLTAAFGGPTIHTVSSDTGWNNKNRNTLSTLKSTTDLAECTEQLGDNHKTVLLSFVNNACGPLIDCGMTFASARRYLARTPAFALVYRGYRLYQELILHLHQCLVTDPKQGKITREWYASALLNVRDQSMGPAQNSLQQYIFLRDSSHDKWFPKKLRDRLFKDLTQRVGAAEDSKSKKKAVDIPTPDLCKICGTKICPAMGLTTCVTGFGAKHKAKARSKIKELIRGGKFQTLGIEIEETEGDDKEEDDEK